MKTMRLKPAVGMIFSLCVLGALAASCGTNEFYAPGEPPPEGDGMAAPAELDPFLSMLPGDPLAPPSPEALGATSLLPDPSMQFLTTTPYPRWVSQVGTAQNDVANAVAVGCSGDVYTAGYTYGSFAGPNASLNYADLFLAKHTTAGNLLWKKQLGSTKDDQATGVAVDCSAQEATYVAGYTLANLDGNASAGLSDIFLTKYDAAGTKVWTKQLGSSGSDYAHAVATDSSGNVYVAGYTSYASLPGQVSAGKLDAFVAKYDKNGALLWTRQFGTAEDDQARGVATDASGNIYVAGYVKGDLDGGGPGVHAGVEDAFIRKYDTSGAVVWTRQTGTSASDFAYGLATSKQLSGAIHVYAAGYTKGSLGGTYKGSNDAVVLKYDGTGSFLWAKQFGTPGNDSAFAVASDGGSNVYVTGSTNYELTTDQPNPSLNYDIFTVKMDKDKVIQSVNQLDSNNQKNDVGLGVAADRDSGVFTAGYTDTGTFTGTVALGNRDIVLHKRADGCTVNTSTSECDGSYTTGDPHLLTPDSLYYDFQGYGEFVIVESTDNNPLMIQVRQAGTGGRVTLNTAVATKAGADRVALYAGQNPPLKVNGAPVTLGVNESVPLDAGKVLRLPNNRYIIALSGGERIIADVSSYMNLYFRLPNSRKGKVRGLLGNFNDIANDDFALRDGTPIVPPMSFPQMYTDPISYAGSWRITQAESLFDYGPGQSTATFTNLNYPTAPIYKSSLPPAVKATATQTCTNAGITDPVALDNCILDVGVTGDASFATAGLEVQAQTQVLSVNPEPPVPVSQGVQFSDFEGAVGPEWSVSSVTTSPSGTRTFLGEFGNQIVTLTLNSLPAHTTATVSFDLLILRDWDGDGPNGPNFWKLYAGADQYLTNTTFSNTDSTQSFPDQYPGLNPAGFGASAINSLLYPGGDAVYPMTYTFQHADPTLVINFAAEGLLGVNNEAWGLDNVDVQLN
jgi:hypothetical protein